MFSTLVRILISQYSLILFSAGTGPSLLFLGKFMNVVIQRNVVFPFHRFHDKSADGFDGRPFIVTSAMDRVATLLFFLADLLGFDNFLLFFKFIPNLINNR